MSRYSPLRLWSLILAVAFAANSSRAQQVSREEQEVLDTSAARREAYNHRDLAALDRYVADDCLISTDDGTLVTKADLMRHLKNLPANFEQITNARDLSLRLHGSAAVISLRWTAHERFGDSDIVTERRRTETWMKRDGAWVLVALQTGNLPKNFRKPVITDARNYKAYVGESAWRRGGETDIVSLKNGKLWSQLDGDEDEYLPLGSDTFFVANDLGNVTFNRDAGGRVTGYTYHRVDGQGTHVRGAR